MNLQDVKFVFGMPKGFFESEGLETRIHQEFNLFKETLGSTEKEKYKNSLNAFYLSCMNLITDKDLILLVKIRMYELLNMYAWKYDSVQTFRNIINEIENPDIKQNLFSKYPYKAKYVYADTLFSLYNLEYTASDGTYSKELNEIILKAKYYALKIYAHHIEGKQILNKNQLESSVILLSGCLSQLSRWFEPVYYLSIIHNKDSKNPNFEYMRALNLNRIKEATCTNYNGQLLLEIIDSCKTLIDNPSSHEMQKAQMKKLASECRALIKSSGQSLTIFRKHKTKYTKAASDYNLYQKYCLENHLYINEHSLYCTCALATRDDLNPETHHEHTKIPWVSLFDEILNSIVMDYINARLQFFESLESTPLVAKHINSTKRQKARTDFKKSLLRNSFKSCYSILDQIGQAIFKVMNMDPEKILLENNCREQDNIPKLYFLNMWDFELFQTNQFKNNFYLTSLHSIAQDLNRTPFAALKDYKAIRNSLEHSTLEVLDVGKSDLKNHKITREELETKTKLILMLTKSAIYSFNNLIRRQSKLIILENS